MYQQCRKLFRPNSALHNTSCANAHCCSPLPATSGNFAPSCVETPAEWPHTPGTRHNTHVSEWRCCQPGTSNLERGSCLTKFQQKTYFWQNAPLFHRFNVDVLFGSSTYSSVIVFLIRSCRVWKPTRVSGVLLSLEKEVDNINNKQILAPSAVAMRPFRTARWQICERVTCHLFVSLCFIQIWRV